MNRLMFFFIMFSIVNLISCSKDDKSTLDNRIEENVSIELTSSHLEVYNELTVTFTAYVNGDNTKEANFFLNGQNIGSSILHPYSIDYKFKDVEPNEHTITCIIKSEKNNEFKKEIKILSILRLGDSYQGGKIFKINPDGKSGLIASTKDLEYDGQMGFHWGESLLINTSKDDGKANTEKMINVSPNYTYGAYHFKDGYSYNGYNDWYIPSINELKILKDNKHLVGGFTNDSNWKGNYWSSSEINATNAEALHFNVLMGNSYGKQLYGLKIRPIRRF